MKNIHIVLSIVVAIFTLVGCNAIAAPAPIAFAQWPQFMNASISPNGKYFSARVANGGITTFTVFDMENGGNIVAAMQESYRASVEWSSWANDNTLVLRLGFLGGAPIRLRVDGESETYYAQKQTEIFVLPISENADEIASNIWNLTFNGEVVHMLPNDPDHILVQEYGRTNAFTRKYPGVYKKSVRADQGGELVQRSIPGVYYWRADRNGSVRVGYGRNKLSSGRIEYKLLMRANDEKDFRDLADRYYTSDVDQRFVPYAFAEDIDQIYVGSNHETDTLALYLFDVRTEAFVRQVFHNPDFDISSVNLDSRNGKLVSVAYGADGIEEHWFDADLNREIESIAANFPGYDVSLSSYTIEANAGIVGVQSPSFPGQLYLYSRSAKQLSPLPVQYPALPEEELGISIATSYAARDGATIPAFVTLPPGITSLEAAGGIPFVIYPHGGPASRSFLGYDSVAQFFATRGYGVLQMNFRGSSGYGLEFEKAGRRQWGQLMQDDVTDGVNWLIGDGIAAPDQIAIYGASYGGYTALMGAVRTPELYQCAVSFAGVTNLPNLVAGAYKDSYISKLVGDRFKEASELRRNSPLHRAESFDIPVLLIHGKLDYVVPYEHSEGLSFRLKAADKDVEFVTLPQSSHGLNDYDDRVKFFEVMDDYMAKCLPT